MLRELRVALPLQAGKGYSVTVPEPVQLPATSLILTEARVAVTPMGGALRFGGTMEVAGLDQSIKARRVQGIINAVPDYLPAFNDSHFADIKPWAGLRPCSPDGMPYIGRTKAASNLVIATGHAMMGVSLAPVTGEIVGDLVGDQTPRFGLSLLAPDRFA
jgi:D-amino-acid dehydrogenase